MATKADKRKRELQAYAKKRTRRPEPTVMERVPLEVKRGLEQRMVRNHAEVLRVVESTLVHAWQDAEEVDDYVVEQVLRYTIRHESSEDPIVQWMMGSLVTARQQLDVTDDVWRDAHRVVYTSLKLHSSCEPGDVGYLHFVSRFVG